ncbi:unnamed protein product, partial [Phaeothamnion confervicola]
LIGAPAAPSVADDKTTVGEISASGFIFKVKCGIFATRGREFAKATLNFSYLFTPSLVSSVTRKGHVERGSVQRPEGGGRGALPERLLSAADGAPPEGFFF